MQDFIEIISLFLATVSINGLRYYEMKEIPNCKTIVDSCLAVMNFYLAAQAVKFSSLWGYCFLGSSFTLIKLKGWLSNLYKVYSE